MPFRAWKDTSVGIVAVFPALAAGQDLVQTGVGQGAHDGPVSDSEVPHGCVGAAGCHYRPRDLVEGDGVADGAVGRGRVGFRDPVAAGPVAGRRLLPLECDQQSAVGVVESRAGREALLVQVAFGDIEVAEPRDGRSPSGGRWWRW